MRKATKIGGTVLLAALAASGTVFGQVAKGQNQPKTTDPDAPPLITGIFPPAAMIGKETKLAIKGVNLKTVEELLVSGAGVETASFTADSETKGTVVLRVSKDAENGTREVRAAGIGGLSNLLVIRLDRLEQVVETEPNDVIDQAKPIAEGGVIVGRLTRTISIISAFTVKKADGDVRSQGATARRRGHAGVDDPHSKRRRAGA